MIFGKREIRLNQILFYKKRMKKPGFKDKSASFQMSRKGKVLSKGKKENTKAYFVNRIRILYKHSDYGQFETGKQNFISRLSERLGHALPGHIPNVFVQVYPASHLLLHDPVDNINAGEGHVLKVIDAVVGKSDTGAVYVVLI